MIARLFVRGAVNFFKTVDEWAKSVYNRGEKKTRHSL